MHESATNRSNRTLLWAGIAVVTLAGIFGLRYLLRDKVVVRASTASYQDLLSTISTNGKVEPVEDFEAHAPSSGAIQKVYVKEGELVHKGQLLLVMTAADARARVAQSEEQVKAAQLALQSVQGGGSAEEQLNTNSELATAQLQVQQAQRDLAATQKLQQSGAASAAEVASAQQRLANAQNALNTAQGRKGSRFTGLDRAHAQAALNNAQSGYAAAVANLHNVEVHAPFDGTAYSVPVSDYDYVNPGDDLVHVADLKNLRIRAYFDEPEIGKLAVGQSVKIQWDAKPDLVWHGEIVQLPETIVTVGTRNVGQVLVSVDPSNNQLLPDTHVNATVTTLARPHVLAIPREALHTDGGNYVFILANHTLEKRAVQIGGVNLTQVEIVSGLQQGESVVLGATAATSQPLSNGMHVDTVQ